MAGAKIKKGPIGVLLAIILGVGGLKYAYDNGMMETSTDPAAASEGGEASDSAFAGLTGSDDSKAKLDEVVGTAGNPIVVNVVEFQGYAGLLVANGGSLTSQPGSIFDTKGVHIKAVIGNDVPASPTLFGGGLSHCVWRTSDFWAQEQPNLRSAGFDGRGIMIIDNTQGADAIIVKDPSIKKIEDLAGRTVGLLQFTPSHGLLLYSLENSSLSSRKQATVQPIYTNIDEGLSGVRAQFESDNIDAAVLWDPELSLALETIPGARVIYSTKVASSLIYDVLVCDKRVLDNPANEQALTAFVDGWLEGNKKVNSTPKIGTQALIDTEPMYTQLASTKSPEFITGLFKNIVLTDLAANVRILGLAGDTNQYANVYSTFDRLYRATGETLKDRDAPVIQPSQSFDARFVRKLMAKDVSVKAAAQKPEFTFTAAQAQAASKRESVITKPVEIDFATNRTELAKIAEKIIDSQVVPILQNNSSAYIKISGNTDSTGTAAVNKRISHGRAGSVAKYLTEDWGIDHNRLVVVGNGPSKPLCNEQAPEDGLSLDQCRARNRTTRVSVIPRDI